MKMYALKVNFIFLIVYLVSSSFENVESVRVCKEFSDYLFPNKEKCFENTDAELNATQIIRKWGFIAEEYYLRTQDGYEILVIRSYSTITRSTPIVMGHGIYMNCLGFVDIGQKSLTYILNKLGYDVWLINFRGTRYSSNHANYSVDAAEFWNFSFHEMGIYDLPETLKLVFKNTHQKSLYVGYSMGSTVSYVFASALPLEASYYLKGMISLAPVAYLNDIKSVLKYGAPFWPIIKPFVKFIWKGKVLPRNKNIGKFCGKNPITMYICELVKVPIFGDDFGQVDAMYRPVTNMQNPDTIGINVVSHYDQILTTGRFQHMDLGTQVNMHVYGTKIPPLYKLSNIKVPVILFVGLNDWLATKKNAERLCRELINSRCSIKYVKYRKWNHPDFVTAKDLKSLLNDAVASEVLEIEKFSKQNEINSDFTDIFK